MGHAPEHPRKEDEERRGYGCKRGIGTVPDPKRDPEAEQRPDRRWCPRTEQSTGDEGKVPPNKVGVLSPDESQGDVGDQLKYGP